jgi:hypothetical protein
MKDLAGKHAEVCSERHLKDELVKRYGDHLVLGQAAGRQNVISFRNMASMVINDKWYNDRENSVEDDSRRVVIAVAKLIRAQVSEVQFQTSVYPDTYNLIIWSQPTNGLHHCSHT